MKIIIRFNNGEVKEFNCEIENLRTTENYVFIEKEVRSCDIRIARNTIEDIKVTDF